MASTVDIQKTGETVVVVVVVVDFIYSRWSNRQSLLKGTYWIKKKGRKGQKREIWEGRINWLNHYGMNYNTELEIYIQLLMSPTVNEMNLGYTRRRSRKDFLNLDCENVDISDPETDCRAFHRIGDRFVKDTVPEREEDRKG